MRVTSATRGSPGEEKWDDKAAIIRWIASLHCGSKPGFGKAFRQPYNSTGASAPLLCTSSSTQIRLSGNQNASGRGGDASFTKSDGLNILDHADK